MNAQKFTQKSLEAIREAQNLTVEHQNMQLEQEHLLAALLTQEQGLVPELLLKMGIPAEQVEADALRAVDGLPKVTGSGREAGKIYVSEDVDKTLTAAERKAESMKDEYVSVEHLFLCLIELADDTLARLFRQYGIEKNAVLKGLMGIRGNTRVTSDSPEGTYDALKKYGTDLVERARSQKMDPVIGTMACPVCGTALQPDDVWLKKGSSGWYTLSQCPVCAGKGGEAGRGVFQKYRMSRRDGLHWAFARCIQMPDDASLANWKRQRAQYLERQRIKAEKQAAEAAQNT